MARPTGFRRRAGLRNTLTPYRGSGLQNVYGAGGGGISHLAREVGAGSPRRLDAHESSGARPTW